MISYIGKIVIHIQNINDTNRIKCYTYYLRYILGKQYMKEKESGKFEKVCQKDSVRCGSCDEVALGGGVAHEACAAAAL